MPSLETTRRSSHERSSSRSPSRLRGPAGRPGGECCRSIVGPVPGARHGETIAREVSGSAHHYDLHVWLWKDNPNGLFSPTNPGVKCVGYPFRLVEDAPPFVAHPS